MAERKYWLFKSEPTAYSYGDLLAEPDQTAEWDGVRNYQVRNLIRDEMKVGDGVLFYHSSANPMAVVGTAVIVKEAHPDSTAWDPNDKHFDAKSTPDNPVWLMVEIQADQEFAEAELKRTRDARSLSPQAVSESEIQSKLLAYRTSTALLRSASHNEEIARFELDQTRAALIRSRPQESAVLPAVNGANGWNFTIRSPINGRVLRVFQESSAVVSAGTPLLELGDPLDLEVEIDVLSRDAVKIPAGAQVLLEHWGGLKVLQGRVRLVEPSAFTKISTLGVEEQRVNVIVDLLDPPQDRTALGDGFRVEARIIVQEADDVLKAPTSALFRVGENWAVFRVERGVAHQQLVQLGLRNGLAAEVLEGLSVGDQVVVHPGDHITDGTAVRERD